MVPTAKLSALLLALALLAIPTLAQEPEPPQPNTDPAPNNTPQLGRAVATVHGIVRNAASGEPLPRTLVLIGGESGQGALTDGDGRFEISGVPTGPEPFELRRPGFDDAGAGGAGMNGWKNSRGFTHNVFVTAETPELTFAMRPNNSIRGHIELSTGDPAQNISIILLERAVDNGRALWRPHANTRTNADGNYHFGGLSDGLYAISTEPAMDSDMFGMPPVAGNTRPIALNGYPAVFYPAAREFSGAAKIQLSGGGETQANMTLTLEPFHLVRATVNVPPSMQGSGDGRAVMATLIDADGHQGTYGAQYDSAANSVQTLLPDGTYTLRVSAMRTNGRIENGNLPFSGANTGQIDFTVAGKPITNLRVSVAPVTTSPVQVIVMQSSNPPQAQPPNAGASVGANGGGGLFLAVSPANPGRSDAMMTELAHGPIPGNLDTNPMDPGTYWVHTTVNQRGLCAQSFTAGGASLAREPLAVGLGGTTAPLTLTLGDDCASLQLSFPGSLLSIPGNLASMTPGEEPAFTTYVVPDFDSTVDINSITLSPGGTITLNNLTPGPYHVYTFTTPVELEYHNPEALATLPSQTVTLEPGSTNNLIVEAPKP